MEDALNWENLMNTIIGTEYAISIPVEEHQDK